jgi:hypothetical protein
VKPGFYVSEGTIENECKIKEMKICVAIEIKETKLIVYHIKNVTCFTFSQCSLSIEVATASLLNPIPYCVQCRNLAELAALVQVSRPRCKNGPAFVDELGYSTGHSS